MSRERVFGLLPVGTTECGEVYPMVAEDMGYDRGSPYPDLDNSMEARRAKLKQPHVYPDGCAMPTTSATCLQELVSLV